MLGYGWNCDGALHLPCPGYRHNGNWINRWHPIYIDRKLSTFQCNLISYAISNSYNNTRIERKESERVRDRKKNNSLRVETLIMNEWMLNQLSIYLFYFMHLQRRRHTPSTAEMRMAHCGKFDTSALRVRADRGGRVSGRERESEWKNQQTFGSGKYIFSNNSHINHIKRVAIYVAAVCILITLNCSVFGIMTTMNRWERRGEKKLR